MYKKILVPLDGSQLAECTLEHAVAIANGCQVHKVVLLAVVEIPQVSSFETFPQRDRDTKEIEQSAQDYLTKIAFRLAPQGVAVGTDVVRPVGTRDIAEEILAYANDNEIDLIIMSTHGRSGVTKWALGTVADRVARASKVPVLLVSQPGCRK